MGARVQDFKLTGVVAAPCTPFTSDGDVNLEAYEPYADHMVRTGITGIFVNGTLGEGLSMTVTERKVAAEKWMSLAANRFDTVIVHVGAGCMKEAQELAAHAESIGAHAIAALSPVFFKPDCIETLVEYLKPVAAAAPNTPFYYYEINVITGLFFDLGKEVKLCKEQIPTFRGIKYSCREMANYEVGLSQCENGKFQIAIGTLEEEFLPWLALGATVPICHSFMGKIHAGIRKEFEAGNMAAARKLQSRAQTFGEIKRRHGGDVPVSKALLRLLGVDMGQVRLPLAELNAEKESSLKSEMTHVGFFEAVYE